MPVYIIAALSICMGMLICPVYAQRIVPEASTTLKPLLGQGYSSQRQTFHGLCIQNSDKESQFSGAQTTTASFDQTMGQNNLEKELGFQVGGKVRFGVGEASAGAQFQTASSSSGTSLVTIYKADYKYKSERIGTHVLTGVGSSIPADNKERWETACGDEVVTQIDYGARLYYTIRIDFATAADRSSFQANFNITGPAYETSSNVKTASKSFSKNARVTIGVLQFGGDIGEVSRIFNFSGGADTRSGFVACTLGDFEKCHTVLEQALAYATEQDTPGSFPYQLTHEPQGHAQDHMAELAYITQPYEDIGIHHASYSILDDSIKGARTQLSKAFELNFQNWLSVSRLLSGRQLRLSDEQAVKFQVAQKDLSSNLDLIRAVADTCYEGNLSKCPSQVQVAVSSLRPFDSQLLNIKAASFAQFSDIGDLSSAKADLHNTFSALVDFARSAHPERYPSQSEESKTFDYCQTTAQTLADIDTVDISGRNASDLAPFAFLKHLKVLYLAGNHIKDVSPLGSLSELILLDLGDNELSSVMPLANLDKLNQLVLIDNPPGIHCPFSLTTRCRLGNYKDHNGFHDQPIQADKLTRPCFLALDNGSTLLIGVEYGLRNHQSTVTAIHAEILTPTNGRQELATYKLDSQGVFSTWRRPMRSCKPRSIRPPCRLHSRN